MMNEWYACARTGDSRREWNAHSSSGTFTWKGVRTASSGTISNTGGMQGAKGARGANSNLHPKNPIIIIITKKAPSRPIHSQKKPPLVAVSHKSVSPESHPRVTKQLQASDAALSTFTATRHACVHTGNVTNNVIM